MSRHVHVCEQIEYIFLGAFFQKDLPDAKTDAGPESRDANFVNQDGVVITSDASNTWLAFCRACQWSDL